MQNDRRIIEKILWDELRILMDERRTVEKIFELQMEEIGRNGLRIERDRRANQLFRNFLTFAMKCKGSPLCTFRQTRQHRKLHPGGFP